MASNRRLSSLADNFRPLTQTPESIPTIEHVPKLKPRRKRRFRMRDLTLDDIRKLMRQHVFHEK